MLHQIKGDLLATQCQYIAHQCNCVTSNAAGLAYMVFDKYPYANVYSSEFIRRPGEIVICGDGINQRFIIGMLSQKYPGTPGGDDDNISNRLTYFDLCLSEIKKIPNLREIAFPYKIGCGLAGGNWDTYYNLLRRFSEQISSIDVYILDPT